MYPTLFKIGPITIRSYGVLVATAFLVTFLLLYKRAKRKNFYPNKILDLELFILIFGMIGARLLHVLVNLDFYRDNFLEIFLIWRGGLAIYGALALAILASWIFLVKNRMPFWETADFIAPYIALGQSIGRIGCFLNGCCFGKIIAGTLERHPTQLYASLALLSIFVILRVLEEKKISVGSISGLYLLLYSSQRFFVDFFRADLAKYLFNLTISQIISIFVFIAAVLILHFANERNKTHS